MAFIRSIAALGCLALTARVFNAQAATAPASGSTVGGGLASGGFTTSAINPFASATSNAAATFTYKDMLNFNGTVPADETTSDLDGAFFGTKGGAISGHSGSGTVGSQAAVQIANDSTLGVTNTPSTRNGSPSVLDKAIPEPATIGMIAAGLLALCFARRKRARKD